MGDLKIPLWRLDHFVKWLLALVLVLGFSAAIGQNAVRNFDHVKTGFPLTGVHASTPCEACHKNGVFQGTPRTCSTCHVSGSNLAISNVVRSFNHFQTPLPCSSCHTTSTFAGARYDHVGVAPGACASCHNSVVQPGKPFGHIVTDVTCSQCHTTKAWLPAIGMDHRTFTAATNCTNCHNGIAATGKIASHVPTANNCASCHTIPSTNAGTNRTTGSWMPTLWNHSQMPVANRCSVCHTGAYSHVDGKPNNHIPYQSVAAAASANCDTCHKGGYASWYPGWFHANVTVSSQCATCHLSNPNTYNVTGKPANAVHSTVTGNCESCHVSTSVWLGVKPNHSSFTAATNCVTCHDGTSAPGQNVGHLPSGAVNCESCHSATALAWKPSKWSHTQMPVTGQCATCHSGAYLPADGKPANHIPYAALAGATNCDSCHKGGYAAWYPGRLHSNITVTGSCETCHLSNPNTYAVTGKPSTAIHTGVVSGCESCHTTTSWFGARPNHAIAPIVNDANCARCHDGTSAPGKLSAHFPTTANCLTCHSPTASTWKPATWTHTEIPLPTCSTCHTGTYPPADGKIASHIPYATIAGANNCDSCHKGGYAAWYPGRFHTNIAVTAQCETCHLSTAYGVTGKSTTPIHTGVTNGCESCHNTSSWFGARPNHTIAPILTDSNCARCHNGSAATGKNSAHFPTTVNCLSCHNPVLSSWKPASWNHTQMPVVAQCSTCHTGTYLPADGKTATHIPYATLAGASNCDSCHKGGYTSWNPGQLHANISVAIQCVTCHQNASSSSYAVTTKPFSGANAAVHTTVTGNCESCHHTTTSWASSMPSHAAFNASTDCLACHGPGGSSGVGKSANHIATSANCVTCHSPTAPTWRPSTWKHNQGVTVTGACATCHNGIIATGKPTFHISTVGTANCDTCHTSSPVNVTTPLWKPTGWNHTQVVVANSCSTCHDGAHAPAHGKTANHIPYQSVTGISVANCNTCHAAPGYASWNPGLFHANVPGLTTQCATCHLTSAYGATGKPGTSIHATVTGSCESCHSSTTTWLGAKPNHSAYTAATVCTTCHNGTSATGKNSTHFPTTANCVSCHSATLTVWKPSTWNHTQMTVVNQCATCHTGGFPPADGKTVNHVPYQALSGVVISNCDTCHKGGYSAWNPGRFHANVAITTQCATCHLTSGYGVTAKPSTAIHATVTGNCESCHTSSSTWLGAKPNHGAYTSATVCTTCHNGTTATGKNSTHFPTTVNCVSCHSATLTVWKPSTWNHTQMAVANQCATCHSGAYAPADGKTVNHIPYASVTGVVISNCDTCHKGGYLNWRPGQFHLNVSLTTQCATCHLTTAYGLTGKPATAIHSAVTGNCESCHKSPSSWLTITYTHAPANAVGTGTCDTCHNGTTAKGKTATHIPIPAGVKCDACHTSQSSFVNPVTSHSAVIAATCKSCHNGAYASEGARAGGALGKPANHIPEAQLLNGAAMDCKFCHLTTSYTSTANWVTPLATSNVMHNGSQGNGSGWCKSCHATGTAYLGSMDRKSLSHDKSGKTDCSLSGCHIPLGTKGVAYTRWK